MNKRKKRKIIIAPKCDYCGQNNESFIITATQHTFCMEQTPGYPATKDCHTDWLNHKDTNVQEEKEKGLQPQKEKQSQEKEKVITSEERAAIVAKLNNYKTEMKQRRFREKRLS
ncbi:hypothetical protein IDH09_01455 [Pelagibacterales bacterium SAG-MED28]|jgi:hypothetical protein|nr:hypothetical protein [Pelagibacterales bacterium SAG-MED28]